MNAHRVLCISFNSISNEEPRLENAPNQWRGREEGSYIRKRGDHLIPCQTVKIAFKLNIRKIMMITMIMIKIAKAMMMMAMPD